MQELEIRTKNRTTGLLWLLPLIALAAGLYLAYSRLSSLGSSITIRFDSAQGLEAGKTKIRFKSLDIGTVTNIEFTDDYKHVIVHAQMNKTADGLLKKDSQFWVVKPQISANGITGLDTILSGSFIAVAPGTSDAAEYDFTGLDEPPLIPNTIPGIRIKLSASNANGLHSGSPVYYRGFKVGQIDQIKFDTANDRISLEAFINAPYDKLITNSTKFWNVSGINFKVGANGADISMESLETLALGGISFSTPISLNGVNTSLDPNSLFTLYPSKDATDQEPSYNKQYYVLYFDDSVRGLADGAPVEFNGIEIGQVIDIRLLYDDKLKKAVIPVLIELEPERISRINTIDGDDTDSQNIIANLIAHGLEASMRTGSLITGDKYIELSMYSDAKHTAPVQDPYSSYPIMPSRNTGLDKITDDISEIADKVKRLPLDQLAASAQTLLDNANSTVTHINTAVSAQEIQHIGKNLDTALKQFNTTLKNINSTSQAADKTLRGLNPESSLYYNLNQTLQSLQKTSKNINRVMQQIDAKPNSLILGD